MIPETSKLKVDFSFNIDTRGVYHNSTDRVLINPAKHSCLEDMVDTLTHEIAIHYCLADNTDIIVDDDHEHWMTNRLTWIKDGYVI